MTAGATGSTVGPGDGHASSASSPATRARIANAAFSADGRLVATSSNDKTARIWDVATGETPPDARRSHRDRLPVRLLARRIAAPDREPGYDSARLWDVATGAELRRFAGHTAVGLLGGVHRRMARTRSRPARTARSASGTSRRRSSATRSRGPTSFMYALDYSPDGKLLFAGNADGTSQLWDVATQTGHPRAVRRRPGERGGVLTRRPLRADRGGGASGGAVGRVDRGARRCARGLRWPGGGRLLARWPRSWSPRPARPHRGLGRRHQEAHHEPSNPTQFSAATISPDGTLPPDLPGYRRRAERRRSGTSPRARSCASSSSPIGILDATFAPDGQDRPRHGPGQRRPAVGRGDTAKLVREFRGHTNIMWRGTFSPDGRYVFTTSQDKSARMWDVKTGEQVRYFPGHALSAVAGIAVSPDGRQVAIGELRRLHPADAGRSRCPPELGLRAVAARPGRGRAEDLRHHGPGADV